MLHCGVSCTFFHIYHIINPGWIQDLYFPDKMAIMMMISITGGKEMILYHGSRTGGIPVLEPRIADHGQPYIYLSTLEVVAALYLCNAVERPYYWFPYGFQNGQPDVPVYDELYPDALREVSEGVRGWIYYADIPEDRVLPFKNIPCARLSVQPVRVDGVMEVADAYALLKKYESQGRLIIGRYEDKSQRELKWYYQAIQNYLREKKMQLTPDCSYARFIRQKFPFVWDRFINTI